MRAPPRRSNAPSLLLLVAFAAINLLVVPSCLAYNNAAEAATVPPTADGHLAETLSTYTHARRTPNTVDEAIHMHCGEVLRVLENKWLPTARTDPVTQERVLHVGFLGDSLACFQFDATVKNIATCVKGKWDVNVSKLYTAPHPPPPSDRAVFTTTSASETRGMAGVVTRIVVTYARNRYSMGVASFLQEHYSKTHANSTVKEEDLQLRGSGWPAWVEGPSPHILYVGVGSWDCHFARRRMHGYDHSIEDVLSLKQNITWPERLLKMDKLFDTRFTQPMRGLMNSWQEAMVPGTPANGDLNGTTSIATKAGPRRSFYFSPPDHFFLLSTPLFDCRADAYRDKSRGWLRNQYRRFNGFARCNTLLLPAAVIVRTHFHAAMHRTSPAGPATLAPHAQQQHNQIATTRTRVLSIDGNDYRDACGLDDGVHFTVQSPTCWERLLLAFWGLF